jgi:c-di-GMP-binding flagellar brake protein YcgR
VRAIERRRHPRYSCSTELEIEWGSEVLRASVKDISNSGMFIATNDPLWMRAEFSARIPLPQPLVLDCVVRRIEPGRGMGVEFKDVAPAMRKALDEYLWKLAAG